MRHRLPGASVRLSSRCQPECIYASWACAFPLPRPVFQIMDTPWPLPSSGREESDGFRRKREARLGTGGGSVPIPARTYLRVTPEEALEERTLADEGRLVRSRRGRGAAVKAPGRGQATVRASCCFCFLDSEGEGRVRGRGRRWVRWAPPLPRGPSERRCYRAGAGLGSLGLCQVL